MDVNFRFMYLTFLSFLFSWMRDTCIQEILLNSFFRALVLGTVLVKDPDSGRQECGLFPHPPIKTNIIVPNLWGIKWWAANEHQ